VKKGEKRVFFPSKKGRVFPSLAASKMPPVLTTPDHQNPRPKNGARGQKTASGFFGENYGTRAEENRRHRTETHQLAQPPETETVSGAVYHRFRYYTPDTGRWLTPDPIRLNGGFNLYSYSNNNSIMYVDKTGLAPNVPDGADGTVVCDGSNGFKVWIGDENRVDAECSRAHEEQHISDFQKRLPNGCVGKPVDSFPVYPADMTSEEKTAFGYQTECHAYTAGLACRQAMYYDSNGQPKTPWSQCAREIFERYISRDTSYKSWYCGLANE